MLPLDKVITKQILRGAGTLPFGKGFCFAKPKAFSDLRKASKATRLRSKGLLRSKTRDTRAAGMRPTGVQIPMGSLGQLRWRTQALPA